MLKPVLKKYIYIYFLLLLLLLDDETEKLEKVMIFLYFYKYVLSKSNHIWFQMELDLISSYEMYN